MLGAQCPRALLVDDDQAVRDALEALLTHFGLEVIPSSTVIEALRCLNIVDVEIVLMDALLPGDPLALAAEIDARNIPLLLMSGHPDAHLSYSGLRHVRFLAKPFNARTLSAAISQALAGRTCHETSTERTEGERSG